MIHAQETYQERNEDLGRGGQLQWILMQAGHIQGNKNQTEHWLGASVVK